MNTFNTIAECPASLARRPGRGRRGLAALLLLACGFGLPIDAARAGTVVADVEDAASGQPLPGIQVTLFDPVTAIPAATAVTGALDPLSPATASFADVPAGEYILRYEDPAGVYAPTWSGGSADPRFAHAILVTESNITGPDTVTLHRAHGHVLAEVFDDSPGSASFGERLGGIRVTLYSNATGGPAAVAFTGTDPLANGFGVAEFPAVAPGEYMARFEDPSNTYGPVWSGGADAANLAEVLPVTAGGIQAFQSAGLRLSTATILVQTAQDGSGDPVGGIEVTLFDATAGTPFASLLTGDDPNGEEFGLARFSGVPAGSYVARFEDPTGTYEPAWSGQAIAADQAQAVTVAGGELNGFDAYLSIATASPTGPGTVTGAVADDATGERLEGIQVIIHDASSLVPVAQETTDADGLYARALEPGSYVLRFEDPQGLYLPAWYAGAAAASLGQPVTITTAATSFASQDLAFDVTTIPPQLPPPTTGTGHLEGEVRGPLTIVGDGIVTYTTGPVAGANVVIVDAETGDIAASTVTGGDGRFSISLPAPRSYLTLANDGERMPTSGRVARVQENQTTQSDSFLRDEMPGPATGTAALSLNVEENAEHVMVRVIDLVTGATVASGKEGAAQTLKLSLPAPGRYAVVGLDAPNDRFLCTWAQRNSATVPCTGPAHSVRPIAMHPGLPTTTFIGLESFTPPPEPEIEFTNIHGLVTDTLIDTGTPLAGIQVDAFDSETGLRFSTAVTTAQGNYSLGSQVGRSYILRFLDPAGVYGTRFFAESSLVTGAVAVSVETTSTVTGVNIALEPAAGPAPGPAQVTGEVRDATTFDPLPGIVVEILDRATLAVLSSQVTDSFGTFDSEVAAPVEVLVRLHDPQGRYATAFANGDSLGTAQVHGLSPGSTTDTDSTLQPLAGSFHGEIRHAHSFDLLPGMIAAAINLKTGAVDGVGVADGSGQYRTDVPGPGSYVLLVTDPDAGFLPVMAPNHDGPFNAAPPTVLAGGEDYRIDVVLRPASAPFFAEVRNDVSFDPLQDIELSILDRWSLDLVSLFTTDAAGQVFDLLPAPADYLVRLQDPAGVYLPEFFNDVPWLYNAQDLAADPDGFVEVHAQLASNTPPAAVDDAYTVDEDQVLNVTAPGVLGNDTDTEGDALSAALVTGPAHGTLGLNADGSFSYTPDADFSGIDSFAYAASDGANQSPAATVTITVIAVNDAPAAVADDYATDEDVILQIPAPGVLANDSDPDGNTLTAALVTGPANGSLTLNADGSFTYTPNADFFGNDSFTYAAFDGTSQSPDETVTITVNPVNDAPTAVDDAYATDENSVLEVPAPGLLANDGDAEGNALTAVLVTGPANGTLALNADGSFSYTPDTDFSGTDSFTYAASDGSPSGPATATITVNPVNGAPSLTSLVCTPTDPIPVGGEAMIQALLADSDSGDTHLLTVDWGDGSVETTSATAGSISASHVFTETGVFEISVTAVDAAGAQSSTACDDYIVVFDPDGGFVTGGGWIESPAGAYMADPALTGRASFGFVSKYRRGANRPEGTTEFQFKAGDLSFQSTLYDWLVVAGSKAMYKGEGMVNGEPGFGFLLSAIDGHYNSGSDPDRFRIKIWRVTDELPVYDNQVDCGDDTDEADPCTELGGGSIVIHTGKKK